MTQSIVLQLVFGAHLQFSAEDGLPQRVCRKCISAVRAAFDFKKMCEESDVKLREYFGQHLVTVKEDKFDIYFVDDSCDSGDVNKFDTSLNADYSFADEQITEQKVIIESGNKMHTNEILMDTKCNDDGPNDRPIRYTVYNYFPDILHF